MALPAWHLSPVSPLSPLQCGVLLCRMLAALTASTVTIASAIEGVGAAAVGSRIDDSFLLGVIGDISGWLQAALMQPRRRDGDRYGAAACRSWPDDSGGRCGRLRRVVACFFGSE